MDPLVRALGVFSIVPSRCSGRDPSLQRCVRAPCVDEPFGLVYLQAMAAGCPRLRPTPVGQCRSSTSRTGWLVPSDDVAPTAQALAGAVGLLSFATLAVTKLHSSFASATRGPPRRKSSRTSTKKWSTNAPALADTESEYKLQVP